VPPDLLVEGPESDVTLVLAHGAGAPMDSPFLNAIARGVAASGTRVARFEFPYMAARRNGSGRRPPDPPRVLAETWRSVVEVLGGGGKLVIGGKSLGGRVASMIADQVAARGLVCLGYPFHPPGDRTRARTAHLSALSTPTLIVQGMCDPFGGPQEVAGYDLSARIHLKWIEDGDHSLKPRARSCRSEERNLREAVALVVGFLRDLS
jgi:predicted alpha/beta-hydrolase family hydrolase